MEEAESLVLSVFKTPRAREQYLLYFLRSHWRDAVGSAAAVHSQPYRLENGVLYIHTDNAMWSHTLLVMKGRLQMALKELIPKKELHGRGKNKTRSLYVIRDLKIFHGPITEDSPRELPDHEKPFMPRIDPERRCPVCGAALIEGEKICSSCARQQQTRTRQKIHRILCEIPWISFEDCRKYVDCDKMSFTDVKAVLCRWSLDKALDPLAKEDEKAFAVMLSRGIPPEKLTDEKIKEVLESERRSRYHVSSSGKQLRRADR